MSASLRTRPRCFATKFFTKLARKARIAEQELCRILEDLSEGKATDLGGGVYKKRLNDNQHRSIILAKSDRYWVLEFLFAKKDADNITEAALDGFRTLADAYAALTSRQLRDLLLAGDPKEICHDSTGD
jgi:hypothetical protein